MIVLDASVVVASLIDQGSLGASAREIMARHRSLHAPDLLDLEVTSALRRHHLAGATTARWFQGQVERCVDLPARRWPSRRLLARVVKLAQNVTVYDAAYVALAESLEAPLATFDARLIGAPGARCTFITPGDAA